MKNYRFFYHFYKQYNKMSVHFRGKCNIVDDIICEVSCETKWNRTQPKLVMRGYAKEVKIENNIAYIK